MRRRSLIYAVTGVAFGLVCQAPASSRPDGLGSEELHRIAWPAARDCFNRKYAAAANRSRAAPTQIPPLPADAYARPTAINKVSRGWVVMYGGGPAGPTISVSISEAGAVTGCDASYALK